MGRVAVIDIAFEMSSLGGTEQLSPEHLLHQLTTLTARLLPGCCAASITVWDGSRVQRSSISHLDLAALRDLPRSSGDDPERHALTTGETVVIPDTLAPAWWRVYSAAAAAFGIRSVAIAPVPGGPAATFGCYSTQPQAFTGTDVASIAGQAGAVLRAAEYYGELASDRHGLRAGLESRSVIDQAIGILIAQRGCSAKDAFAEIQRLSQTGNLKLADVARRLVSERSST